MMKNTRYILWIMLLIIMALPAYAAPASQDGGLVDVALAAADEICSATGRNQACYAHILINAQAQRGIGTLNFEEAGDITDVARIRSLRLSALDPDSGAWGIALMRLQADLPTSGTEHVTLLAFGDVELENRVESLETLPVTIRASQRVNVRTGPATINGVLGTLASGETVDSIGRSQDASWVRIIMPDSGRAGWISTGLVTSDRDLDSLPVIAAQEPYFGPMQAFFLHSAENDRSLTELPGNGILIQTPEGVGEVNLLINEVNIQLGSTVFFEANGELIVTTLEGHADVTFNGFSQTAFAGTYVTVPLNEDMSPAGPPNPPQPFDPDFVGNLPHGNLDRPIEVAPPLTQDEIIVLTGDGASEGDGSGSDSGNADGNGGSGRPECPGNSCEAPGNTNGNANGGGQGTGNANGGGQGTGNANGKGNG